VIEVVTIIGVGLIGGSLARALKQQGFCKAVVGVGRDRKHLGRAQALGVVDRCETDLQQAVQDADLVVVAVPLGAVEGVLTEIRQALKPDCVVTDVGSAKVTVVDAARRRLADVGQFVPGHPIAGNEKSGVEASQAALFRGRRVILTPLPETRSEALQRVREMWAVTGAEVVTMTAEHHDDVLAATSHLPHLLAYGLVDTLLRMDDSEEIFRFAAGGFRDFTRIASSDPTMWHDICLHNSGPILRSLKRFIGELTDLADAIERHDSAGVRERLQRAKAARDRFVDVFH